MLRRHLTLFFFSPKNCFFGSSKFLGFIWFSYFYLNPTRALPLPQRKTSLTLLTWGREVVYSLKFTEKSGTRPKLMENSRKTLGRLWKNSRKTVGKL